MNHSIIASSTVGSLKFLAINGPVGDARNLLSNLILSAIIGTTLSRVIIYLWMRQTSWRSPLLFPWAISVMIGMFSIVLLYGFFFFSAGGLHTPESILIAIVYIVFLWWPIVIILGATFIRHILSVVRETRFLPNWGLFVVSVACL